MYGIVSSSSPCVDDENLNLIALRVQGQDRMGERATLAIEIIERECATVGLVRPYVRPDPRRLYLTRVTVYLLF